LSANVVAPNLYIYAAVYVFIREKPCSKIINIIENLIWVTREEMWWFQKSGADEGRQSFKVAASLAEKVEHFHVPEKPKRYLRHLKKRKGLK